MTDKAAPDWTNPNREPVLTLMDLAKLDEAEMQEGYADCREGLPCGDNRSRSYWHGWRNGSRDGGYRPKNGDMWDAMLAHTALAVGTVSELSGRVEACRKTLRDAGLMP